MGKPESDHSGAVMIYVDVARQELRVWADGTLWGRAAVSTSRHGLGCFEGSHRTPSGWHRVSERIGDGHPDGTVFESREPVGHLPPEHWSSLEDADRILTRIWWLEGLEAELNHGDGVDSYERMIYLHGTNREQRLGIPDSIGCVRLGNVAMRTLFDEFADSEDIRVWIGETPTDLHRLDPDLPPARGNGIVNP